MLELKNGGRRDFWISHVALVERFVQTHLKELTKVQTDPQQRTIGAETGVAAGAAARVLMWDPTRGGMRTPHLHYGGELYVMSEPQWAELSKAAVSAMTERMTKAQRVGFDTVMQLSDVVAGM
ncbi:hypothetical protein [Anaeromyxobacter sp. PSR-1]|uniref:hypothetical protein n=1 Tax=Anaeromyxobacter sp. PSR-1 TaxID=1300915 RepID=UPI00126A1D19|nr:hypothetical protein [Anaeromyxobacter sp. PSR-1]